jgi:retinol dehydrogenase 12
MTTGDLSGKTFVITGANTGIGRATVEALAAMRLGRIIVAARSKERTEPVLEAARKLHPGIDARYVPLELGELASVKRAASEIAAMDFPIDALINNAGVAGLQGLTKDGFELTFGTNHLGPFLFTEILLPLVKRAPQGRIVNVASRGHYRAAPLDFAAFQKTTATTTAFPEYCTSKLCNVLHAKELARRLSGTKVTTYSLHPGAVASDIWQRRSALLGFLIKPFLITNEKGARTQVKCATDPSLASETGLYYDSEKIKEPSRQAKDVKLADELHARSSEWVKPFV